MELLANLGVFFPSPDGTQWTVNIKARCILLGQLERDNAMRALSNESAFVIAIPFLYL